LFLTCFPMLIRFGLFIPPPFSPRTAKLSTGSRHEGRECCPRRMIHEKTLAQFLVLFSLLGPCHFPKLRPNDALRRLSHGCLILKRRRVVRKETSLLFLFGEYFPGPLSLLFGRIGRCDLFLLLEEKGPERLCDLHPP